MNSEQETPQPEPAATWRQAGRAQHWQPLRPIQLWRLRLAQGLGAIALFWGVHEGLELLIHYYRVHRWGWFPRIGPAVNPWWLGLLLLGLLMATPWWVDWLLRACYGGLEPLTLEELAAQNPEAAVVLRRCSHQWRLPLPSLKIMPIAAPVVFTYGSLPRFARIIVSRGLLQHLAVDEVATLYAGEMAHLRYRDLALLSLLLGLVQVPYQIYSQVSRWGDKRQQPFLQGLAALVAAMAYGLYRLGRWPGLWLSRLRLLHSDRTAVEITGNPNGLVRALLKLSLGLASEIQQQQQTSEFLESFAFLLPVSPHAVTSASLYPQQDWPQLLRWEYLNPYRHWLGWNQTHPFLGDRLHLLQLYARYWQLEPELDWSTPETAKATPSLTLLRTLLLQGAPYFGAAIGGLVGLNLWLVGWVALKLKAWELMWLYRETTLIVALGLIGFGMGTLAQINTLFPDLKPSTLAKGDLLPYLTDPALLPLSSPAIALEGKLLGRRGIGNWLGQDLWLQSQQGLIRLQMMTRLGPLGHLWPWCERPTPAVDRVVQVSGWFRRGAIPLIDVDTLQGQGQPCWRSGHPLWSTLLAGAAILWGLWIIYRGRF